jgi:hypothetical protein
MPTLDDIPLILKVSEQLGAIQKHQREFAEALMGFLARQEKREERSALQEDSGAETMEQLERAVAEIGKQVGRMARVAAEALEAARTVAQASEARLQALEDRAMVRRNQDRRQDTPRPREQFEEDDRPEWHPDSRRRGR